MAKKSVSKVSEFGIEDEKPSYLTEMESEGPIKGADNFSSDDIGQPMIKIIQGSSQENETYDEAKPGIFWHTGADIPLGKEITFVVANRNKKILLQAPIEDGQGILARSQDAITWDRKGSWEINHKVFGKQTWTINDLDVKKSGLAEWGTAAPNWDGGESPPAATLFYDYLIIALDEDGKPFDFGPAVLSLARTQIARAKKGLNNKITMHAGNGRPMQALVFKAEVVKEGSGSDAYYNLQFHSNGFATEALFKNATELGALMENFTVKDEGSVMGDSEAPAAESDDY